MEVDPNEIDVSELSEVNVTLGEDVQGLFNASNEGCPCLNVNLKCCGHCKCGTKKAACKNKAEDGQVIANPSAFARHRRAVEESEIEIKVK